MDDQPTYDDLLQKIRILEAKLAISDTYEQRMERNKSIGSIGHEFNNLLMGIQGNLSLIFLDMDRSDALFGKLKDIEQSVDGGVKLTEKLFDFLNEGSYTPPSKQKALSAENINRLKSEINKTINSQRVNATYGPPNIKAVKVYEQVSTGSNRLLLVDDDPMILDVGKQMLERTGLDVMTAKGGPQAIDIYSKEHASIDMVLLDLIMPQMTGIEVYHELKKINPAVKVLFSSGYRKNMDVQAIVREGRSAFIQKPFKMEELTQEVGRILEMP